MVLASTFTMSAYADEPNEDFNSATALGPGVLSVLDTLTSSGEINPDTILGTRDQFGDIEYVDDDSSPIGDGLGSALYGVLTNSGSIDFAVTGYDDFDFVGGHLESGNYEVFVDVYDSSDELIESFSTGTEILQEGFVNEYSFSNVDWIGGSYDVYIDNGLAAIADVDFFTFTELTPGEPFSARTLDPDGIVPENGELTFAVTGCCDDEFIGHHFESGAYGLELTLNAGSFPGDFNNDGEVDGADYVMWRKSGAPTGYNLWRANFGSTFAGESGGGQAPSIPEPATLSLLAIGYLCATGGRRKRPTPEDRRHWPCNSA
jgi:PEP-CTERM motif